MDDDRKTYLTKINSVNPSFYPRWSFSRKLCHYMKQILYYVLKSETVNSNTFHNQLMSSTYVY